MSIAIGHGEQERELLYLLQDASQPIPSSIHIHDTANGQAVLEKVIGQIDANLLEIDPLLCPTPQLLFNRIYKGFATNATSSDLSSKGVFGDGSTDAMLHAIRAQLQKYQESAPGSKQQRFIIILKRADRMRDLWPEEISNVLFSMAKTFSMQGSFCLITISHLAISHFRASKGPGTHATPPDSIVIRCGRLPKEEVLEYLDGDFDQLVSQSTSTTVAKDQLRTLFDTYTSLAYDAFAAEIRDLHEIRLLTCCVWHPFIRPVLNGVMPASQLHSLLVRSSSLFRYALEQLHTRRMNPLEWIESSIKQVDEIGAQNRLQISQDFGKSNYSTLQSRSLLTSLVVLAAFLASYNPARLDVRYFVRDESAIIINSFKSTDGKSPRKRKRGGAFRKTNTKRKLGKRSGAMNRSEETLLSRQELLGPRSFTLDRMLNIVQALAVEVAPDLHSSSSGRRKGDVVALQDCQDEWEVRSKGNAVLETFNDLIKMGLIVRTSAIERIDVVTTFRVNTGREMAIAMAKNVHLNIEEWIYG
ncbi:uncharacterized protein FA14DRAFT_174919 [Meira miltonrushii]|uniref:Origin recognition complex subunit 5 C-terminal domain-containing protein n=1 Tax=Meira miltonrushii TaxID=1280837 RepID=A0A316V788_9BASI|nr:uncharacterized protein FA14DRAFT_174919 [Meira miltonrushii]PWN32073.1 hypothetical protein FA14DRAFT_174919 [Meira miltonrushii]